MGTYFIKVEDAPDVRRKVLESSKATLHVLRGYQELVRIRSEKLSYMETLRREMKELNVLINRLENDMPILTERELEELNPKAAEQVVKIQPKIVKPEGKWVKKGSKKVFIAMPKKEVVMQVALPKPTVEPKAEAKPEKPIRMTELEKLQTELDRINSKLGQL